MEEKIIICPDCEEELKFLYSFDTDWHGNLKYYWCKICKEKFVSQNDGDLAIAAPY